MKKDVYNLTNPQRSIWLTEQVFNGTTVNNICVSGTIYGNVEIELLIKAVKNVVKQNDSFRIHLLLQDGIVKQYISKYKYFDIETQYINSESELHEIEKQQSEIKFNIIDSDLFKFKIVILKDKFVSVILTANHIIADSWSLGISVQEILKNYHALKNNETINFESESYINYINAENDYKKSSKYQKDKEYWNTVFSSIPEQATIPGSLANSDKVSVDANRINFDIELNTVNKINSFCTENNVSVFNFFMAIYSLYISRVSNTQDFVIGTPILNRTSFKDKHTTGMFVNTVPVRINNFQNDSFKSFVSSLGKQIREILRHQKYSYTSILEDLRTDQKDVANLYNIIISYQITKAFDEEYGNYTTNWTFSGTCANDIDIHIYDINNTGKLSISYDYLINKYTAEDIENIHKRIVNMIEHILKNTEILNEEIETVTKEEKNKILFEFNNTSIDYPNNKTIIDIFEEQVEKTPDKFAIVYEGQGLTYSELNKKANCLANYLIKNGLKENSIVSIFIDKSLESIIAIIATLKCGCCYMPIDVDYPYSRIKYMINHSYSKYILTVEKLQNKLKDFSNVFCVDLNNEAIYNNNHENTNINSTPDSMAYIMYTSGSTGKPKGVMVSNKNIIRLVKNTNYIKFNENDRLLQTGSIVFDACTFEIWGALLNGLELYIIPKKSLLDPIVLEKYIIDNKISILWITAPLFNQLSEQKPSMFSTVRVLLTGGDVLSPKHINNVRQSCPNLTIINGYGPTENTTFSTCFTINKNYETSIPIGYPIANSTCYIVSRDLQLVPIGVPGELLVGGDGVSKGYLNSPETTSAKFIPNIFGDGILYKTGDLVKWNPDGSIDFIGRIDSQVKIRGFRVELDEINLAIQKYKGIKECITVIRELNGEKIICTYFSSLKDIDIDSLKNFLKKLLPYYSIPAYFIRLDCLPINTNGKVDQSELPMPQFKNEKNTIVLPRNDIDAKLINILKDILKVGSISIDDNFFDLGGDSLSAINLSVRIQNDFNSQIFVKDILEHPQVQDLSDFIAGTNNTTKSLILPRVAHADYYPVSSAQKRIYFTSQMAGNSSTLYNTPGGVLIDGYLDEAKLIKCFNELINRHETLRTFFDIQNENTLVQKIIDNVDFKFDVVKNANYSSINDLFKSFVKPFDLNTAPLLRAQLIEFTNNKSALFMDMHHIISDGMSMNIFIDEFCKLYNGKELSKKDITYKDFAVFESQMLENDQFKEAENYWVNQFNNEIPVLNMPTNFPRPAVQSFEGKKVYTVINKTITKKIEHISHKLGITPYMFLLACYYILLSKYTLQEDIVVGSPIVGRDIYELYNVIGMFVNTLALRNKVDSTLSFKDFVLNLKNNVLDAYKYQAYPFDELVNKLHIKRDTSRSPLFDTMFIYQNNGFKNINIKNTSAKYYIPDTNISKFDLTLEAIPINGKLSLTYEFSTCLFTEDFINNLSNHYLNIIKCILNNIDTKISDIEMLSESEKNKILYEFNNTSVKYPKEKTLASLFEEQVEKTPDNIAVVFKEQQLTYRELNDKANSLAKYLREKENINRNDLVGIMVNRSLEMIVAILAVLKAGGAYIPIDPTYPKERIEYMLKQSDSKILLTLKKLENSVDYQNKLLVDLDNASLYNDSINNLEPINKPEDLAYVIFTSGSTGLPKGVMLRQNNIINFIYGMMQEFKFSSTATMASLTTISFDIFVLESLLPLLNGLKIVIASEEEQTNIKFFNDLCLKNKVDIMQTTPSRMQAFISNNENLDCIKNATHILIGGEPFPKILLSSLKQLSNAKIYNMYGPTETAVWSSVKDLTNTDDITVGKPIINTQFYILDKNLKPLQIGVAGDIYISGDGVSNGYLKNNELTNKSFIKNPFIPNTLMYKTGDTGMYNERGEIICLGRTDSQVKIRGLRIELEEIETTIQKYPNIEKAIVVKQSINDREFISAYYIANKNIDLNKLRKYISKFLPRYMLPSFYIAINDIPYTPNGKIDKKALPLPENVLKISKEKYIQPNTDLQRKIAKIWRKLLKIQDIGIYDNFFELGGDSLLAMNLNVELLKITNNISYQDIFRFPTIAELEEKIISNDDEQFLSKIENLSDSLVDILKNATKYKKTHRYHPKGILITGATGFLGIHVLEQFIKFEKGNIYCIVRENKNETSRKRLYKRFKYYFGDKYNDLIDKRIFAITGDITKPGFGLGQEDLLELANSIDLVINSAANVFHYGNYNTFYKTNVTSVKYIVDFCNSFHKKLYHVSTISVADTKLDSSYLTYGKPKKIIFNESCLYIGQPLNNIYTRTKFEAEAHVLEAVSKNLDGYILRMGHLMPRYRDGLFQKNILENDFVSKVITFMRLGFIPDYLLNIPCDFTPVDSAARAIYKIITYPNNSNRIFHLFNNHSIKVKKIIKLFKKYKNIEILSENKFKDKIKNILDDENKKYTIKNLINDFDTYLHLNYKSEIIYKSKFTNKYLRKLLFEWPIISKKYLFRFINLLRKEL